MESEGSRTRVSKKFGLQGGFENKVEVGSFFFRLGIKFRVQALITGG